MAKSVKVTNKLPNFSLSVAQVLDDALRDAARDILVMSRNKAPFAKGGLRAESEIKRVGPLHQRVSYWKEYARFQEFGGDAKRRVRNYTTSGTGKNYLKSSGDQVANTIVRTFKKHAGRAKP